MTPPRPISVTAVGWLIIAMAGLAAVGLVASALIPHLRHEIVNSPFVRGGWLPLAAQLGLTVVDQVVRLVCGVGVLKRSDWARYLYPGWSVLMVLIAAATGSVTIMMLPGLLIVALLTVFLFRADATAWFKGTASPAPPTPLPAGAPPPWPTAPPSPASMARKVLAIIVYVAAGFAVYFLTLLSFAPTPPGEKLGLVAVPSAIALVLLVIAILINRHWRWQRTTAITLLSGAGFTAFVGIVLVTVSSIPDVRDRMESDPRALLGGTDIVIGGIVLGAILLAAVLLFWSAPPRRT
ncbi:hypothetical protein [Reyranella sp. CPCC 100927]|uniref:hypothetical protein n=1 Tax=Reyranella sp. CPCC 100927 TaxID=2599616 RepID=UPI0015B76F7D|nr:hypothetical protein [Reyranella sp. CPCC 100927]